MGPVASTRPPAPAVRAAEPEVAAVPSGSVTSEPLPPPGGGQGFAGSEPGPVIADVPQTSRVPSGQQVASIAEPAPVAAPSGPTRSGSVGAYTARDATGETCRVNLTSTPTLDLYRASASGCANKDLAKVTAWDFRDGEVYLYQPGGSVAARLRGTGGSLSGVVTKSGAPLTLTR